MTRALCTFGVGPLARLRDFTAPCLRAYAALHGYEYVEPNGAGWDGTPPSWRKVGLLRELLRGGHEAVLWVDADVVVVEPKEDLESDVRAESGAAFAFHESPVHGYTPNAGLLYVRDADFLDEVERLARESRFSAHIWEQAGLWRLVGIDPDAPACRRARPALERPYRYTELGHRWNYCLFDARGIPYNLRFVHLAGVKNDCRAEYAERILGLLNDEGGLRTQLDTYAREYLRPWKARGLL